MSFTANLSIKGGTAVITLVGDLDEANAADFREKVVKAARAEVSRLVLDMSRLDRISSAGLRGLAFCRAKMSNDVEIIFVSPNETVRSAIEGVGFQLSVSIADAVPQ
jgi:anti-anti-sigma factor